MKSDLLPIDVLEFMLAEMGKEYHKMRLQDVQHSTFLENDQPHMELLKSELNLLDPMRRDTLRFLLRHLYL